MTTVTNILKPLFLVFVVACEFKNSHCLVPSKCLNSSQEWTEEIIIQGESPGCRCLVSNEPCTCLDITGPPITNPPLQLQDILTRGPEFLRNYTDVNEAVLMVGNTGVGKTTSTQIIAGDLSKLHTVSSMSNLLFIVDEENRIGLPSPLSKTLFPELVTRFPSDNESELAFYDFPGFDDTRGAVEDIAANFFMTEIVKKITNIKLLFVCLEEDIEFGNRDTFSKLANHAVEFLKEIDQFTSSFALVVNKVDGRSDPTNEEIIIKIVEYLETFYNTLIEEDGETPEDQEKIRKKKVFVETLLTTDQNGDYDRIWFIKSPKTNECGPLSNQQNAVYARANLTQLISRLDFTPVGADVDATFGFTLKDSTIRNIGEYSREINSAVVNAVSKVVNHIDRSFSHQLLADQKGFQSVTDRLGATRHNFEDFFAAVNITANPLISPNIFLNELKKLCDDLGVTLSNKFKDFMYWQDVFLAFFDKAANEYQERRIAEWTEPIEQVSNQVDKYFVWYEFCLHVQSKTFTLSFQSNQPTAPLPTSADIRIWLEYVNTFITSVSTTIVEVSQGLEDDHLNLLKEMLNFALKRPAVTCINGTETAVVISGNFLRPEDFKAELPKFLKECMDTSEAYFLSGHTMFLDSDFALEGIHTVLLTPNIVSTNFTTSLSLNFDGYKGNEWSPPKAKDGENATDENNKTAGAGTNGYAGKPGGPGSQAFVIFSHIENITNLYISTSGGEGGSGQQGGHGGKGWSHPDAKCWSNVPCGEADIPDKCEFLNSTLNKVECFHYGFDGLNAANAGNGGVGGKGGYSGRSNVIYFDSELENVTTIIPVSNNGSSGIYGLGGNGGEGGRAGRGYRNIASTECTSVDPSHGHKPGKDGQDGRNGTSVARLENPVKSDKIITEWFPILQYRLEFLAFKDPTTVEFIDLIDFHEETFPSFSLKGLAEETLALEKVERDEATLSRLGKMYSSLLFRLEKYYQLNLKNNLDQYHKIASMLLSSVFASFQSFRNQRGLNMIVDVAGYFNIVEENIETLAAIEDRNLLNRTIHTEKQKFVEGIEAKVHQARAFISDIVVPAVEEAQNITVEKIADLGQQLRDLINDNQLSLEQALDKLREAEIQQRNHEIYKLSSMASKLLSGFIPGGDLFDGLIGGLEDEFKDSSEKIAILNELVQELKEMGKELQEQSEIFDKELVPLVESMLEYFDQVSRNITAGNDISLPELGVTNWQLQEKLNTCKESLEEMGDRSLNFKPLVHSFNRLMDAMTLIIDLLELIDCYQETKGLATYIAVMQSAQLAPIHITDPDFIDLIAEFDITLKENLLDVEVNKAMHAFKQWIFPFAKFYLFSSSKPSLVNSVATPGDVQLRQLEYLTKELEKYKAEVVGDIDTALFQTNFSSGLKSSKPFFTWDKDDYANDIRSLLSGNEVTFDADVTKYGMEGWEAIKFKLIEINLNLNGAPQQFQDEFDELLDYFGVSLTHSGVSYYRFQNDYYAMTGSPQTIMYNFERDSSGARTGTNMVYEKFKAGDFLLSPYTAWSIQLRNVVPNKSRHTFQSNAGFSSFEKFYPYINLELVGIGTYVNGSKALEAAEGNMMLDKHYRREVQLKTEMIFG